MIRCINVGIEPSYDCYDMCVFAQRCEALKAWKRAKAKREKKNKVVEEAPPAEAKTKCIAQIKVDTEELVRRIKEEYNIANGWIPVSERLPKKKTGIIWCQKTTNDFLMRSNQIKRLTAVGELV